MASLPSLYFIRDGGSESVVAEEDVAKNGINSVNVAVAATPSDLTSKHTCFALLLCFFKKIFFS